MPEELQKKSKKLFAGIELLTLQVIILIIVFAAALISFLLIAKMVFKDDRSSFDTSVFNFLSKYINNNVTDLMRFFSFLGAHTFLIPANIILLAYFLFIKKHRWYSIKIPAVALSSLSIMFSLKYIFKRNRPLTPLLEQARGYSFPSGHALVSSAFYGLLIYLVWKNIKNTTVRWILSLCLVLLIIAIGVSRIYLRVHYASDVIAGYCIGLMWLLLSLWVLHKLERLSRKKIEPVTEQIKHFASDN